MQGNPGGSGGGARSSGTCAQGGSGNTPPVSPAQGTDGGTGNPQPAQGGEVLAEVVQLLLVHQM